MTGPLKKKSHHKVLDFCGITGPAAFAASGPERKDSMKIGNREFDTRSHTYIMAILNVTPDSFSDGGKWNSLDAALAHTEEMIRQGADIIDVGGESTRPGHLRISDEEEADRIAPVIEAIRQRFDIPVSVDTYKSAVAETALQAGAHMINDIWGFQYDEKLAPLTAGTARPAA